MLAVKPSYAMQYPYDRCAVGIEDLILASGAAEKNANHHADQTKNQ